ncbi:uncharacterized protein PgNI_12296, partial [Pyricularia grisea]|uniref:Uncharacterized protein n=1 Tax=Pyricularia grisea TaxID=148305 RepID=A0A6P8AMT7_PYRGI
RRQWPVGGRRLRRRALVLKNIPATYPCSRHNSIRRPPNSASVVTGGSFRILVWSYC